MESELVDLDALGLRGGQAAALTLPLRPGAPVHMGQRLELVPDVVEARIEVTRTVGGYAMRLLADVTLRTPCFRCTEPSELRVSLVAREVEQRDAGDDELICPYVDDGLLVATAWLHDAITLELPESILCRDDCAGICQQCGISLNDVGPEGHTHERPPDPRFAKLRELIEPDLGSEGE